jgi:hypothetical protein
MLLSGTVRVRPLSGGEMGRPSQVALQDVARLLTEAGFRVLKVGRFGVSIEGDDTKFKGVLGVNAAPDRALVAPINPSNPQLGKLVDLLEMVPKPQLY